jgi:hypothetical protein
VIVAAALNCHSRKSIPADLRDEAEKQHERLRVAKLAVRE